MIKIYHNPRCSTSRKALECIQATGEPVEIIEYLKTPLHQAALRALIHAAGLSVREAVRMNEPVYQTLDLAEAEDIDLLKAIEAHPILLNRPFVTTKRGTRLCRPFEKIHEVL